MTTSHHNSYVKHAHINSDILRWCILTLPGLYQTTAFGLTGLVTLDMLSNIAPSMHAKPIDLIFLDTLYHFDETLELVERVRARYNSIKTYIYKPRNASTSAEFVSQYGDRLWETDDERYDWIAKVEPSRRAYAELNVRAVLTGRRRSQGGQRGSLDILELEEADDGGAPIIKVNPLANWSFAQVKAYIDEHNVPYNTLLDRGYSSVGDWHSTQPARPGEGERSGRWSGTGKTECGIHNSKSRYAEFLREQERQKAQEEKQKVQEEHAVPLLSRVSSPARSVVKAAPAVVSPLTSPREEKAYNLFADGSFNGVMIRA